MDDILKAFSLNCLVGDTRFAHTRRLQDDVAVATITGMNKGHLCGEDAFRRLCEKLDTPPVKEWFAPAEQMIHHAIPPNAIADWDSTVVVRYGKQEDAAVGYNPQKPGRPSHRPLACVIGGTRLRLNMEWRKGQHESVSFFRSASRVDNQLQKYTDEIHQTLRRTVQKSCCRNAVKFRQTRRPDRPRTWLHRRLPANLETQIRQPARRLPRP